MSANEDLIKDFYTALQNADVKGVRACYAPDVLYSDPIFRELRGERALLMWEMFFSRDEPIKVTFGDIHADDISGSGRWTAEYTFNGRPVHNPIRSKFRFADGRIVEQHDDFSVRKWAAQAIGTAGRVAGGTPPMKAVMHKRTTAMLDSYQRKKGK